MAKIWHPNCSTFTPTLLYYRSVLLLALDTCDSRGSIALLDGSRILAEVPHPPAEEFSSWLLPAVSRLLAEHRVSHADLAGYAVASGPGSFTGVRVGLTTAKAWSEVYGKPIFPVSRLAVLVDRAPVTATHVATFSDAQRNQIFAALYSRNSAASSILIEESVIAPDDFFTQATNMSEGSVSWVTPDPHIFESSAFARSHSAPKPSLVVVQLPLAAAIALHVVAQPKPFQVDALTLDANYVRRSDAEIFGKKTAAT
ncbi:MAG TPA: tRNA (adenosine(37)-N6)-threonylcarbamoyltransferase complex dimerization subunit type 1 TsaB [Candidatus Limnocylindrales bacterium]|nr:tRNA (adenosine(37)-N6)-threonylcarbamoyltransferase complex dimerization subunit type 1 TsaB [Candidatus Limnocylindrales bacterium]